jgi:outer membrane protein TolC
MKNRGMARAAALAALVGALWAVPASPLDLEGVLRQVAASNPTLAARRAMADAARSRVAPAGAWPQPMAEVGLANVPTSGRLDMDPMTMRMVGLTQRVPIFGANRLARRSAREAADAEAAAVEQTGYEVYGMAWEAYADAYFAGARAREGRTQRAVMDRLVQSARARYESGNGRLEDVLRAEAERARVLADVAMFEAEAQAAQARLDALRGVEPGAAAESLAAPPALPVPAEPDAWLAAVTPTQPRLREQDAQALRYRLAAAAARRIAWPDLELRASYGMRARLADGMPQDDMFSVSVGFMLPVFAGQRELAEGREMDAMARAGEAERRADELELRAQVAEAHAAALASQRTVGLLADTVVVTQQRAVEASWAAYGAGGIDLWRVFEAIHALYQEEIALVRAREELAHAQARMLSLTGRGDLLGVALPVATRSQP